MLDVGVTVLLLPLFNVQCPESEVGMSQDKVTVLTCAKVQEYLGCS